VSGIAVIDRAQRVIAGRKGNRQAGLTLGVEPRTGQLAATVAEDDGAGGRKPVHAGDGDGDGGLRAASLVAGLHVQRGLRGQTLRIHRGH
jgi:hypothetical protein